MYESSIRCFYRNISKRKHHGGLILSVSTSSPNWHEKGNMLYPPFQDLFFFRLSFLHRSSVQCQTGLSITRHLTEGEKEELYYIKRLMSIL